MYPLERFTGRARRALALARDEAEKSRHSYIGTEHLLLGLLREGDGLAAKVLGNLGLEIDKVRTTIESALGRNERVIVQQIIPTSRVKKVIEIAFEESERMNKTYVGTEHLLLGLILERQGLAAHVLEELGATLERVRLEIASIGGDRLAVGLDEADLGHDPWDLRQRLHDQLHRAGGRSRAEPMPTGVAYSSLMAALLPPRVGAAARSALALAEEEATRQRAPRVGTDHLLFGLLRQAEGGAAHVLAGLGIDLSRARAGLPVAPDRDGPDRDGGSLEPDEELLSALTMARLRAGAEARWLETGDLLVAISRPSSGRAAEILRRLGVVHLQLEEQVALVLGDEPTG